MALIIPSNYHKISDVEKNHISWIEPELAKWLDSNSNVSSVNYPGLESDPYYSSAKKYTSGRGMGCMLMFSLNGGYENPVKFIDSLKLASHIDKVGD